MAFETLRKNFIGSAFGAGLAGLAAFSPMPASAQSAETQVAGVWTEELRDLHEASLAASAHATEHGAAILLHVGTEIQNHPQSEAMLEWAMNRFKDHFKPHGINLEVFPRMNDAPYTVLEYRIGSSPYTPSTEPDPIIGLKTAEREDIVREIVEQAKLQLQLKNAPSQPLSPEN